MHGGTRLSSRWYSSHALVQKRLSRCRRRILVDRLAPCSSCHGACMQADSHRWQPPKKTESGGSVDDHLGVVRAVVFAIATHGLRKDGCRDGSRHRRNWHGAPPARPRPQHPRPQPRRPCGLRAPHRHEDPCGSCAQPCPPHTRLSHALFQGLLSVPGLFYFTIMNAYNSLEMELLSQIVASSGRLLKLVVIVTTQQHHMYHMFIKQGLSLGPSFGAGFCSFFVNLAYAPRS